jgi:hypothetical protein
MKPSETEQAIRRGIRFVRRSQQPDGSFTTAIEGKDQSVPASVDLIIHALILDLLQPLPGMTAKQIAQKLAGYLQTRISTVSYDTTDTYALFQTLASLYEYNPALVDAPMTVQAVQFLITHEREPGGPYHSVGDTSTSPDIATNIVISRFLHHLGGPFTKLNTYIARHYTANTVGRYFTATWPLQWQLQHTPLACTPERTHALGLIDDQSHIPVGSLVGFQQDDGSWPLILFCHEPDTPDVYGSTIVDTLLMLCRLLPPTRQPDHRQTKSAIITQRTSILQHAHTHANTFAKPVANELAKTFQRIVAADTNNEITSFARGFAPGMQGDKKPSASALILLDTANLYNWTAYSLYDTLLDTNADSDLLPIANVAMRAALQLFCRAVPNAAFTGLVRTMYDRIDTANYWEVTHCRAQIHGATIHIPAQLPDYKKLQVLHDRSLSHAAPVMGTLLLGGHDLRSTNVQSVYAACQHYLIIRHLHDWQEDLRAGQLSYVVTQLLHDAKITTGVHQIEPLERQLSSVFWQKTLSSISFIMLRHAKQAKQHLNQSGVLQPNNVLEQLIDGIEHSVIRTQDERKRAEAFLRAYQFYE